MRVFLSTGDVLAGIKSFLLSDGDIHRTIFLITLVVAMLVLLLAVYRIHRALQAIYRISFPESYQKDLAEKANIRAARTLRSKARWDGLLGLHKLEEEHTLVIKDHDYDGIVELDNPIPLWFNALFYSTIIFGLGYLLSYHVFAWGLNQDQEYVVEVERAEEARQLYLSQAADLVDESSITVDSTGTLAAAGQAIFTANCAACHGAQGEGTIGPNLTDRHWLHGGEIRDIFKTVKYGVPAKGMVPWEQTLTPGQIAEVSNYIISLRDSKPANPKAPEGTEVVYE
ncbi:cbb3-type cytochrome c oxidase N-terminal domain-containing protein [Sphingobacterium corticibacter]|uniref:Cytochrome C n=1 Tax=Sphingobacterium corticibacter TaxID=2171749 RepID=A0A2T8HER4_9SPHI|nr:cbb3-type cytochrome c oxidase N-terminal domain-containing protein [Sphingobacterium corticibacter]PVH23927.1 cytochrome C [Sphingobacterium corticibacter]